MEIYGFEKGIAFLEAKGLAKCFNAYADACGNKDIAEVGFNASIRQVYIALENGINISSILGSDIKFLVTDFDAGKDYFFDSYDEAEKFKIEIEN